MTHNLKALALALLAVFATSMMAAQAASAQDLFTSDSTNGSTILTGTNEKQGQFLSQAGGQEVTCKDAQYTGTMEGNSLKVATLHPRYTECSAPGIGKASIRADGCDYIFTGLTEGTDATISIECTTGKVIEVEIPGICTLSLGAQGPLRGVHYSNQIEESGKRDITVTVTITSINYTKAGPFCFLVPGNGKEGLLNETVTVTGYEDKGSSQNSSTHDWTVTEGSQVKVEVSE